VRPMTSFIYSFIGYQEDDVNEDDLLCNGHMYICAANREQADIMFKQVVSGLDDEYSLIHERNIDENGNFHKDCVHVDELVPGKNFSLITLGG
jgi:hypothetical protein